MSSSGEFMSLEPQEVVGEDTGREQDQELDLWDIGFTSSALAKLVLGPRKKNPFLIPKSYMKLKQNSDREAAVQLIVGCVQNGYQDKMAELMGYGVPLDQKAKGGLSAVHAIAKEGRVEMLKMIIEHKVPGLKDVLRREDLMFEEKLKETNKMKEEIMKKLDFLWKNKTKNGWRPLHLAIEGSHVDMVELLLVVQMEEDLVSTLSMSKKSKQDQNDSKNKSGKMSPIHIAAKHGSVEVLELMWTWCGVMREDHMYQPFGEQDGKGWNALHHAAAGGHEEVVRWLMERRERCGLDLEARSEKGHTPLLTGAFYKKANVCQLLISYKADVTATANDGMTALHIAALTDDVTIATMVQEGSRRLRTKQDEKGDTPLHIANKKTSTQVSELFKPFADEVDIKNKDGHTPRTILPEDEEYIPQEIRRRGKEAIKIYKNALTFGKTKIPHVKLVVLGKPRHGKTSLLKLLEGKQFVPNRDSTEGIECELVTTSTLDAKFSSSEGQPDVDHLVDMVHDKLKGLSSEEPSKPKKKAQHNLLTEEEAEKKINELFRRRPWHQYPQPARYAQTGHISSNGSTGDLSLPTPLPHDQPRSWVPPKQVAMGNSTSVSTASTARKPSSNPSPAPQDRMETNPPQTTTQHRATPTPTPTHQDLPESPPEVPLTKEFSNKIERALSTRSEDDGSELKIQFTTYDFAGQELYRPMHHCFITQRSMFLIVYNTREFLREEEKRHEHIKYWFNTVSAYTEKERVKGKKPPVFLVGTHRGPYDGCGEEKGFQLLDRAREEEIISELSRLKVQDRYKYHLMTSSPFHFVESSIEDEESSGAKSLKQALEKIADTLPFIHDRYPIRWLQLQEGLEKKELVRIEEVRRLLDVKEEQIDLALKFFHDIGIITYPRVIPNVFLSEEDKEKLKDVILCGPQRLADKMKEVIQLSKHIDKLDAIESDLFQKSIATRSSLETVFFGKNPPVDENYLEYICLFLRAYGLLFPIDKEESDKTEDGKTQFFVPCCLQDLPKQSGIPPLALKRYLSFEFDFDGYLPDELFIRFVCMAASEATSSRLRSPGTGRGVDYQLTRNYCNVDNWKEPGDSWEIWHNASTMKVFVKPPHRPHTDQKAHKHMLSEFTLFAAGKVRGLCEGLQAVSLPYRCGKCLKCGHCSKITFHEMGEGEKGGPPMLACSCKRAVSLEDEFKKELDISRLDKKPTEKELRRYVVSKTSSIWKKVCTELEISRDQQKKALENSSGDVEEAYFDCLVYWLLGNIKGSEVNWRTVLDAVKEAGMPDMAEEIEENILKTE
jgi:ankyrin repeat protein/GTPase SAR1 family protein